MRLRKDLPTRQRRPGASFRRLWSLPMMLVVVVAAMLSPLDPAQALADYRTAIVVDLNSGKVLYQHAADSERYPASLTKMMTLYILFSYLRDGKISMDSPLVVTPHAAAQAPTKIGLKPGQTIPVEDAIRSLVTESANDSAVCIAENLAGTESNFARMMTAEARALGMRNTVYHNASGLPDSDQVTTARDVAILGEHLMRDFPEYYHYFSLKSFTYHGRRYRNHNHLLVNYPGTDGIKTGYTHAAGFNLAVSVHRGDKHLLAVVLGGRTSRGRDASMRALLNKYFPLAADRPAEPLIAAAPGLPLRRPAPTEIATAPAPAAAPVQPISYQDGPPPRLVATQDLHGSLAGPGPYQVQVGSYATAADAEHRLSDVEHKAPNLLSGHAPVTTTFENGSQQWYRARFAGFSEDAAQATCAKLKRMSVDCLAMKAD
jgi:D-alanyl-D-alanine carboxypeptidase